MKIFVAGGTGVIGRRVVPALVQAGHEVTALARTPEKRRIVEQWSAHPVMVSLFDTTALQREVKGHDAVINLATHLPNATWKMALPWSWKENDRVRRDGSALLVDAALAGGVRVFVQESFAPTYPDRGDQWITEETPLAPVPYNRTTVDAERSAERFTRQGGKGIVLRFAYFYGPDAFQVVDMVKLIRKGISPVFGAPRSYFSAVSHDDAASAVLAALELPAGTYNVVDDEPLTREEFIRVLAGALNVRPPKLPPAWLKVFAGVAGETLTRSQRMSNRKLREQSSWAPKYPSVREGWPATLRAMQEM